MRAERGNAKVSSGRGVERRALGFASTLSGYAKVSRVCDARAYRTPPLAGTRMFVYDIHL